MDCKGTEVDVQEKQTRDSGNSDYHMSLQAIAETMY